MHIKGKKLELHRETVKNLQAIRSQLEKIQTPKLDKINGGSGWFCTAASAIGSELVCGPISRGLKKLGKALVSAGETCHGTQCVGCATNVETSCPPF